MLARTRARGEKLAGRARRVPGANLALRVVHDLAVNDITDRSMTLAAQAFTSILPIVILLTALPTESLINEALEGLRVDPSHVDLNSTSTTGSAAAFGLLGGLMTIAGATSMSRALGRMYTSAWQVTKLPLSAWWRWVVVIFVLPLGAVAQGFSAKLHGISISGKTFQGYGALGVALEIAATFLIWATVWTVIPRLLVSSQVPMRLLSFYGAVTGFFVTILLVGSRLALPTIVGETTRHYGTLGLIFVSISWLFFFAIIVVTCAIVMQTVISDDGLVGTWLRGRVGEPHPFPSPGTVPLLDDPTLTDPNTGS